MTYDNVFGLMTNADKNHIRLDIINQAIETWRGQHTDGRMPLFRCLTLPGTDFVFERMLTDVAAYHGMNIRFDCFEEDEQLFNEAQPNVPENVTYTRAGIETAAGTYDLIWADYCVTLELQRMQTVIQLAAGSVRSCLVYVTCCMNRRDYRKFGRQLGIVADTAKQVVEAAMERQLQALGVFKHIYGVYYAGGRQRKTAMMALGYLLTRHAYVPKIIIEDRTLAGFAAATAVRPQRKRRRCKREDDQRTGI